MSNMYYQLHNIVNLWMAVCIIIFSIRLVLLRGGFCHETVMKSNHVPPSIIHLPLYKEWLSGDCQLDCCPLSLRLCQELYLPWRWKDLFSCLRASIYNFDSLYFIKEIVSIWKTAALLLWLNIKFYIEKNFFNATMKRFWTQVSEDLYFWKAIGVIIITMAFFQKNEVWIFTGHPYCFKLLTGKNTWLMYVRL